MLRVADIAALPNLDLEVVAGRDAVDREVHWLHVSELEDPTEWLEGGELLLTTGLGVGREPSRQREYVRRLAKHGMAGLGFGLGFDFDEVPHALGWEADQRGFPVVSVPYEQPLVAIAGAAFTQI